MTEKYILEGKTPVLCRDLYQWGEWLEKSERHVAKDDIDGVQVSTVFLGLDHAFGGDVPILFETMVFGGELDQEMERYSSWEEAEKGHQEMVARIRAATPKRD